jgi:hypothetical protein
VHYGLQDGGEWGDADARANQNGVLRAKDLRGGGTERPVDIDLQITKTKALFF